MEKTTDSKVKRTDSKVFEEARAFYMEGGVTLRAVAEAFGLPFGRLCRESARGRWCAERCAARADRRTGKRSASDKVEEKGASDSDLKSEENGEEKRGEGSDAGKEPCGDDAEVDFSARVETLCRDFADRVSQYIGDAEQFNRYLLKDGKGEGTVEGVFEKADVRSIKEMAQALKVLCECAAALGAGAGCEAQGEVADVKCGSEKIFVSFTDEAKEFSN